MVCLKWSRWWYRQTLLTSSKTTSKLKLKYRTAITQNHEESRWMEVWQLWDWRNHVHPDWKEGCGCRMSWPHIHMWWNKFCRDILGARNPSPTPGPTAQDSSARKVRPHNFWLQKTPGNWVRGRNCWNPKPILLKNLHMDSPTQTHFLWAPVPGGSVKGASGIQGKAEGSGIKVSRGLCPFLNPPPTESASWCHIWDSINLANTVWAALEIPRDTAPPNIWAHPCCFSIWMAGLFSCFTTS